MLVVNANSSLDGLLGESMMTSIRTGNAITTAIVIAMFIYLFIKLNIQFIVRQFVLIIFTVFTPIALSIWIVNRNATAISIWAGQIITNVFMQFIYCFLFLMYLTFLPSGGGWAVSLIWAMMILPLASTIQNSLQDLTSRICGIDTNAQATQAFAMGGVAGGAIGYGISAIKEQFKTPGGDSNSTASNMQGQNNNGQQQSFVSRVKNFVNPQMNLTPEKDYNGNTNPIRDVIPNEKAQSSTNAKTEKINKSTGKGSKVASALKAGAKGTAKATGAYLSLGRRMVEGDTNVNFKNKANEPKKQMQHTEYINNIRESQPKVGDENEYKK